MTEPGYVIEHREWGLLLSVADGAWSRRNPRGHAFALTFSSALCAMALCLRMVSEPEEQRLRIIQIQRAPRTDAAVEDCISAGLPAWLPVEDLQLDGVIRA